MKLSPVSFTRNNISIIEYLTMFIRAYTSCLIKVYQVPNANRESWWHPLNMNIDTKSETRATYNTYIIQFALSTIGSGLGKNQHTGYDVIDVLYCPLGNRESLKLLPMYVLHVAFGAFARVLAADIISWCFFSQGSKWISYSHTRGSCAQAWQAYRPSRDMLSQKMRYISSISLCVLFAHKV